MEALNTLWITLPLKNVTDERATLEAYGFALEPFSIEAIQNTINALRRGEIEGASTVWCPRPPELASYVRAEQKRLDAVNRPPAMAYRPVDRNIPPITFAEQQEAKRDELRKRGYVLVKANVSQEAFVMGCNRKAWPVGAIRAYQTDEVWAPPGAPMPVTGSIIQTSKQEAA